MKLFFSYIKRHGTLIAALAVSCAVFATVFALYRVPSEPVIYSVALILFAYTILGVLRYISYAKRHRALRDALTSINAELAVLPAPSDAVEEDYQELLLALQASKRALATRLDARLEETTEYYTLWAHQIKTPIAAMRLLTEGDRRETLLQSELFKIESYVDMALNYMKTEEGAVDIVLTRTDVDAAVRAALRKYARLFALSHLDFSFVETRLTVLSDERWLQFALEQLISNAIKYTRTGGITIYAKGRTLIVEDTGIGIAAEDLPRICERGYTGFNGRADKKSTGVGLYLTKKMLTKLGHTLAFESAPGRGTAAMIDLMSRETSYE